MKPLWMAGLASLCCTLAGVAAYHYLVVQPALVVAVVDASEVYQTRTAQLALRLTTSPTPEERNQAVDEARRFVQSFPAELARLQQDCRCLVLERSAVAAPHGALRDLTPLLRQRVR